MPGGFSVSVDTKVAVTYLYLAHYCMLARVSMWPGFGAVKVSDNMICYIGVIAACIYLNVL